MEAVAEKKKKINHGRNIRITRTCQNITQEDLAFRVNLSQSKVSALELEEVIEDAILDKFATALNVPVGFLKNFVPEEAMNIYNQTMSDPTLTNTSAENSNDTVTQQIVGEQENVYNYPINDIKELYERLLKEKDRQIEELKAKLK